MEQDPTAAFRFIGQAKTDLSALALKRLLGVSYPTAWLMHDKLMQAMVEREERYLLGSELSGAAPLGAARRTRCRSWPRCRWMPTATRCMAS